MLWPDAQTSCTAPGAAGGKRNTYGPASEPVTFVDGLPLISKSAKPTPLTGSLKLTVIWVSAPTAPGGGTTLAIVGGLLSGAAPASSRSMTKSLLVRETLNACTAMTLVPGIR